MLIHLKFRKTSRLSIRIGKYGDVRVSAPYGTSREDVARFVEEHRAWIDKALELTEERQRKRNDFYAQLPLDTARQRSEAADRMNAIIPPLVEKYSQLMGVKPSDIHYSNTISRWGMCNVRSKRIRYSVYLLLLPDWCIEHVVVHELAHLIVPNHGPKFHAVMDKFFPRWREARKETKRLQNL